MVQGVYVHFQRKLYRLGRSFMKRIPQMADLLEAMQSDVNPNYMLTREAADDESAEAAEEGPVFVDNGEGCDPPRVAELDSIMLLRRGLERARTMAECCGNRERRKIQLIEHATDQFNRNVIRLNNSLDTLHPGNSKPPALSVPVSEGLKTIIGLMRKCVH